METPVAPVTVTVDALVLLHGASALHDAALAMTARAAAASNDALRQTLARRAHTAEVHAATIEVAVQQARPRAAAAAFDVGESLVTAPALAPATG